MSSLVLLPRPPLVYASSEAFPLIVESWISFSSAGSPQSLKQKTSFSSSGWVEGSFPLLSGMAYVSWKPRFYMSSTVLVD